MKKIFTIVLIIAASVIGLYFLQFHDGFSEDQSAWGTFGDYIGGVFAFFAFIAVIYTINIQLKQLKIMSKDLKVSMEEMRLSRQEMKNSVKALKSQNETLEVRNFENIFFELIRMRIDAINNLEYEISPVIIPKGHHAIRHFQNIFRSNYQDIRFKNDNIKKQIRNSFKNLIDLPNVELDAYLRSIILLVRFLNSTVVKNKEKYRNIIRTILTDKEQFLLFYCGIAELDNYQCLEDFKKNQIFSNINSSLLFDSEHLKFYNL